MFNDIPKHKVFLSFHHQDDSCRKKFEKEFSQEFNSIFVNCSVSDGEIDPKNSTATIRREIRDNFISDSTVTIVLIGSSTWKRKHVDWEIGYSLTQTSKNSRSGLIGILLPSPNYEPHLELKCISDAKKTENCVTYTPCNIPPRLYDNIQSGYAKIYNYPLSSCELKKWIHEAYQRRNSGVHDNSRDYFVNNRSGSHWE
ncbi:TIR domain-containing protein [Snodgrassella alvi]|uniref:TIR domain-containing protein n=1 Tax=Snodgrassella alvi TaxID=1196083 RepID=UPI000C1E1E95|nr:TIR domain-containing protein [Snodgrassella alvi]PIT67374.1 hypothetical protein BHC52_04710 [Snodgrassella alvi]